MAKLRKDQIFFEEPKIIPSYMEETKYGIKNNLFAKSPKENVNIFKPPKIPLYKTIQYSKEKKLYPITKPITYPVHPNPYEVIYFLDKDGNTYNINGEKLLYTVNPAEFLSQKDLSASSKSSYNTAPSIRTYKTIDSSSYKSLSPKSPKSPKSRSNSKLSNYESLSPKSRSKSKSSNYESLSSNEPEIISSSTPLIIKSRSKSSNKTTVDFDEDLINKCSQWEFIKLKYPKNPYNPYSNKHIKVNGVTYNNLNKHCKGVPVNNMVKINKKNNKQQLETDNKELCDKWLRRKTINPTTGRIISKTGPIYKKYDKICNTKKEKSVTFDDICEKWNEIKKNSPNNLINPLTKKPIKLNGPKYKELNKLCKKTTKKQ